MVEFYPKPSDAGGALIRKVVASFRKNKIELPLKKPIFIATSGGVDSMSLAHLLSVYGRRVVPRSQITLLHFDHQWRVESGISEKKGIEDFSKKLGVGFESVRLPRQSEKAYSRNLEEDARLKRTEFYKTHCGKNKPREFVLTAHHADDVVETLVWRFFRGELLHQTQGILFRDHGVLRPFLPVFKEELYSYAQSEGVPYFEDPTNSDAGQMRAFFRTQLKPVLIRQFPGFRASILKYAASLKTSKVSASEN